MPCSHHSPELDAGPPPEVLLEIEAAWERAQALFEGGLEIHFEADHARRRAFASVAAPDGARREISVRQAILAACGDAILHPQVLVAV
jgi:hypothetical protein